MPPRIARASVAAPKKKSAAKKGRKRQLDAYAIAGKIAPEKSKIRNHRFGDVEDDEPRKRRRTGDSDEDEEEEVDQRSKRRKQSDDDYVEHGSDSEGNNWTLGEVAEDDDESLDSDMAFGESDEERFEGFTFRGSSGNSKKSKPRAKPDHSDLDLDEDEEDEEKEEDDFGDEGVDLATMLDDPEDEESEDADDESPSEESEDDVDDDDDEEERHARLQDFVEGLDKGKGKQAPVERAQMEELALDDLLEGADLDNSTLATLKPKKKNAPELVTAPLPRRQQNEIDRKLAKTKADEALNKYRDTVKQNREAESLTFPLRDPNHGGVKNRDTFAPASEVAPANELEASIRQIMEESGMIQRSAHGDDDPESDLIKAEGLAMKQMPVEEAMRRRAELARQRHLLFFEEQKAKRQAKIKSKTYRRVHRKEKERLAEKERALLGLADGELMEDEQEVADRRRAEARMNAKHKDSKWAKSLKATNRSTWDSDARAGVEEQIRRQQELRKRIAGEEASGSDDSDVDEDHLNEEIEKLAKSQAPEATGIAGLKFMQRAEQRRKAQNDAALAELQRELNGDPEPVIEDDGLGRAIFGPKPHLALPSQPVKKQAEFEEGSASEEEDAAVQPASQKADKQSKPQQEKAAGKAKKASGPLSRMPAQSAAAEEAPAAATASAWTSAPKTKKSKLDRKLARNDDGPILNTQITDVAPQPAKKEKTKAADKEVSNTGGWTTVSYDDNDDDDLTTEQPMLTKAEQNAALHSRAFAGDDVALQFQAEKDDLVASEDDKEESTFMPGWGSWAGAGLSKKARQQVERTRHNPLYKNKVDGVRPESRRDAKLENVIISEKQDRKGKKYLAPVLPHQYERKEEYERSLRMPIGREWSTTSVFHRNTKPRIIVKPGTIIDPISKPLV